MFCDFNFFQHQKIYVRTFGQCSFGCISLFQWIWERIWFWSVFDFSVIWKDTEAKIGGIDVLFHPLKNERISEYNQFFTKLPFAFCLFVTGVCLFVCEAHPRFWEVSYGVWLLSAWREGEEDEVVWGVMVEERGGRALRWWCGCLLVIHQCCGAVCESVAVCYGGGWHRCVVVIEGGWHQLTGALFCEGRHRCRWFFFFFFSFSFLLFFIFFYFFYFFNFF